MTHNSCTEAKPSVSYMPSEAKQSAVGIYGRTVRASDTTHGAGVGSEA